MSTTIDQRVVEMRFDNKRFEENVKTSMSTLERLKKSLNLTGAAKGLENVQKAAKNVNVENLGIAAEKVGLKFNAMYTMADQVLRNITNRVQHAAENMIKEFTIDPVKTGLAEYETQINAVQTIMANTSHNGTTLTQVNSALDTLNTYADKTIYNFTEMTRNIGTFTAAGVDLQTSVESIQGIANLAAVSGSTSQQASTAMYQLSQALAAGKVSLMDWNSVVSAGMGGKVFQDALVRTSELLGTGAENAIKTYGSFIESLTQGEWLTTKVLTETLKQFAGAYSEADLINQGFTKEQAKDIAKMAETAENAATKVKTFTQLLDTLKESAQSGWTQTWELIIGDFEEAKEIWTKVSDVISGFINSMSESRNKFLAEGLNTPWEKLIEKINKAGVETKDFEDSIRKVAKDEGINVDELVEKYGSLEKAFRKGAISSDILDKALQKIGGTTADLSKVTAGLKMDSKGEDVKELQKALEDLGYSVGETGVDGIIGKYTEGAIKAFQEANNLEVTGIVDDKTLEALNKAANDTKNLSDSCKDLIDNITELGGREMLLQGIANLWRSIVRIAAPVKKAFSDIFPAKSGEALTNMLEKFQNFTEKLKPAPHLVNKLYRTFKGLFAAIDIVGTLLGGPFKLALKIALKLLGGAGKVIGGKNGILSATAKLGDMIVKVRDWIDSLFEIKDLGELGTTIGTGLANAFKAVKKWIKGVLNFEDLGEFTVDGLIKGITNKATAIWNKIVELAMTIYNAFCDTMGIESPSKLMIEIGQFLVEGLVNGIVNGVKWIIKGVKFICSKIVEFFSDLDVDSALESFKNMFTSFSFEPILDGIKKGYENIKSWLSGIDFGKILSIIPAGALLMLLKTVADIFVSVGKTIGGIGDILESVNDVVKGFEKTGKNFNKVLKSFSLSLKSDAIKNIAISLGILVASIFVISKLIKDDPDSLYQAVAVVDLLAVVLVGLMIAMDKLSSGSASYEGGKLNIEGIKNGLVSIGIAMLLLAATMKIIGGMTPDQYLQGMEGIAIIFGGLVAMLFVYGQFVKDESAKNIKGAGKMIRNISISLLLIIGAMKLINMLTPGEIQKGLLFIGAFAIFVVALMACSQAAGDNAGKVGGMILKLSVALLLLVGVCKLVGTLSPKEMIKGGIFAVAFLGFVWALVSITKVGKGQEFAKLGGMLFAISLSLTMMIAVCKLVGLLSPSDMIKGGIFAAAFLGFVWALVSITKIGKEDQIAKASATILAASLAIGILGAVSILLGFVDTKTLARGVIAVSILGVIMSMMIKSARGVDNIMGTMIAMAASILVMATSIAILSMVDTGKLIGASVALSMVMGMFSLISKSSKGIEGAWKSLIVMTVAIGVLGGMLYLLSKLPVKSTLGAAISLSVLLLAMSGAIKILSTVGPMASAAYPAMIALGVLIGATGIVLAAIAGLNKLCGGELGSFLETGIPILLAIGEAIGGFFGAIIQGFVEVGIIDTVVLALDKIGTAVADFAGAISGIDEGSVASAGLIGDLLSSIASANLKNAIANLLGGDTSMETFGAQLSAFAKAMVDFSTEITKDGGINVEAVTGAATAGTLMAELVNALPKTGGIWQSIAGEQDLATFGAKCVAFGAAMVTFSKSITGENAIDATAVGEAAKAGTLMAQLETSLPKTGGLWQTIAGEQDLAAFGAKCAAFGAAMVTFSNSITGENSIDTTAVEEAAKAGSVMAQLEQSLPKQGGLWQTVAGATDLANFGLSCAAFGSAISKFSKSVSGENAVDVNAAQAAADAGTIMSSLESALPKTGGWWQTVAGEQDLADFGAKCEAFGAALSEFSKSISGENAIDTTAVESVKQTGLMMTELQAAIPTDKWFDGKISIDDFGEKIGSFGTSLVDFSDAVADMNIENVTKAITQAKRLVTLSNDVAEMDTTGVYTFESAAVTLGTVISDFGSDVGELDTSTMTASISAANKLKTLINGLADLDNSGVEKFKVGSIGKTLKSYSNSVAEMDTSTVSSSISIANRLKNFINSLANIDTSGVASFKTAISSLSTISVGDIAKSFGGAASKLVEIGGNLMTSLSRGMKAKEGTIGQIASSMAIKTYSVVAKKAEMFKSAGVKLMSALIVGLKSKTPSISTTINSAVSTAALKINAKYMAFYNAGKFLGSGLVLGINAKQQSVYDAAYKLGQKAVQGEKDGQQSKSPSKATIKAGKWFGEGLIIGIDSMGKKVYDTAHGIGETAVSSMSSAIARVSEAVNTNIDSQPTIRPVLDLSDVEAGAGSISGMFGNGLNLGVSTAAAGNVAGFMNNRVQNGTTNDVISAIDKLRKDLGNVGGNSYSINGITYDDGSNVANAINALIRAAKIDRRV